MNPFDALNYYDFDDDFPGDLVPVYPRRGASIYIRRHVLEALFPTLREPIELDGAINLRDLVLQIQPEWRFPHVPTGNSTQALRTLFGMVRKPNVIVHGLRPGLFRTLNHRLDDDLWMPQRNGGLKRCRSYFLTFAHFADHTESASLATALAEYFLSRPREIARAERATYLQDWGLAFEEIRRFLPEHVYRECMRHLYPRRHRIPDFDDYDLDRGRNKYLLPDPYRMPRARTVPPRMHLVDYPRQIPRYHRQLLLPPVPTMMVPALPSPSLTDGYRSPRVDDDIQDLAFNQEVLQNQLQNLNNEMAVQNMQVEALTY
jgi:hypothetical protein